MECAETMGVLRGDGGRGSSSSDGEERNSTVGWGWRNRLIWEEVWHLQHFHFWKFETLRNGEKIVFVQFDGGVGVELSKGSGTLGVCVAVIGNNKSINKQWTLFRITIICGLLFWPFTANILAGTLGRFFSMKRNLFRLPLTCSYGVWEVIPIPLE
jgi:hypothetical protein